MKKLLCLTLLMLVIVFAFASCDETNSNFDNNNDENTNSDNQDNTEHTHVFGEWVIVREPGCISDGLKECSCECGEKQTESIPANGTHVYDSAITNPTCTAEGYTTYTCECGHSYVDDITAAIEHSVPEFNDETIESGLWIKVETDYEVCPCIADTLYYPVCQFGCGVDLGSNVYEEYWKILSAPGHVFNDDNWSKVEAMPGESPCLQSDMWINDCAVCFDGSMAHINCSTVEIRGNAPGHTWGSWSIVTAPTESTGGECIRECTVCTYNPTVERISLPALNTTDYAYSVILDPTCTEDGKACYTYSYNGTTLEFEVVIPSNGGHDPAPAKEDCIIMDGDDATYYTYKCNKCNNNVVAYVDYKNCNEHSFVCEIITEPTMTDEGRVSYVCSKCETDGEITIPSISNGAYQLVSSGTCFYPMDTYAYVLTVENTTVEIEVKVEGDYHHDPAPAKEDCMVMIGSSGRYYTYKCSQCKSIIVAYFDKE